MLVVTDSAVFPSLVVTGKNLKRGKKWIDKCVEAC